MNMIDKAFGLSPDVLTIRARKTELIADNLANADTPHYKAMDIDFAQALSAARDQASADRLASTNVLHITNGRGLAPSAAYRMPSQPSLDGNTVESDIEHMAFMDNALRYQASIDFLNGKIKGLLLAIRGE